MKRILSTAILCMLVCSVSFAQKKAVKEAKNAMNSEKYGDARTLIKPALTDPETESDPETWKVAGDIENKAFEAEQKKQMLGKAPDEEKMYSSLYGTYDPYVKADALGELPDAKGKIKNKYRKDISAIIRANHAYFVNGGLFYNEKKQYSKAADFFQKYWETPSLDMFKDDKEKVAVVDSTFQIIKYYAVICANEAKEYDRAVGFLKRIAEEPFTPNSTYTESHVYELLAAQYLRLEDSTKYVQTLEEGAKKYPKVNFFTTNLVNVFIRKGELNKAIDYLDQAIANDPSNACEFYSVKAGIYNEEKDFDNTLKNYETALSTDPNCERALEGLAIAYIIKAQDTKELASKATVRKDQTDLDAQAKDWYKKALPLLEKFKSVLEAREAKSSDIKSTLYKLINVYYNLNMNDEYEKLNKIYESME